MKTKSKKIFYWLPRILSLLSVIFISLFALDSFSECQNIWLCIIGFLIHLIPSFVLIFILYISWKWEAIGGLLFISLAALYAFIFQIEDPLVYLVIPLPLLMIGILFIINYLNKKKK